MPDENSFSGLYSFVNNLLGDYDIPIVVSAIGVVGVVAGSYVIREVFRSVRDRVGGWRRMLMERGFKQRGELLYSNFHYL